MPPTLVLEGDKKTTFELEALFRCQYNSRDFIMQSYYNSNWHFIQNLVGG